MGDGAGIGRGRCVRRDRRQRLRIACEREKAQHIDRAGRTLQTGKLFQRKAATRDGQGAAAHEGQRAVGTPLRHRGQRLRRGPLADQRQCSARERCEVAGPDGRVLAQLGKCIVVEHGREAAEDRRIEPGARHAQLNEPHGEHRPNGSVVERVSRVDGVAAKQPHPVIGVGGGYRGGTIRADAGRPPVDVESSAELRGELVGALDGRDSRRRDRDPLTAIRERNHVGDGRGSIKHKHGISLLPYRRRAISSIITKTHTLPLDGI